jgi:hypothetical protein
LSLRRARLQARVDGVWGVTYDKRGYVREGESEIHLTKDVMPAHSGD